MAQPHAIFLPPGGQLVTHEGRVFLATHGAQPQVLPPSGQAALITIPGQPLPQNDQNLPIPDVLAQPVQGW